MHELNNQSDFSILAPEYMQPAQLLCPGQVLQTDVTHVYETKLLEFI